MIADDQPIRNWLYDEDFQDCWCALKKVHGRTEIPLPRLHKCWTYFQLAKAAHGGCIVELGTWRGYGAIALWHGAQCGYGVDVYTVDLYKNRTGWAGEKYDDKDHRVFESNVEKTGIEVFLVIGDFADVAKSWSKSVSLLVWDGGTYSMAKDSQPWLRHIITNGVVALHDTTEFTLGSRIYVKHLIESGYNSFEIMPGGMNVVKKG